MGITLPPFDEHAEESVLGSLIIRGETIMDVEYIIQPLDFYLESNQFMYQSCLNLRSRRESINQTTISQELKRMGKLDTAGGFGRFFYLISICPTSLDIVDYAKIVKLFCGRGVVIVQQN